MDYLIIGVLAAAFGAIGTLFLHKYLKWQKEYKNEEE